MEPYTAEIYGVSLCYHLFQMLIISQSKYSFLSRQSAVSVHKTAGFMFINWISKMV
jgi:hypothetical protein